MDTENPATQGRAVGATPERPTRSRTTWRSRSRWLVHLCLLASVAGAFATLQLLHTRNAIHADVGLVFSGSSLTTWHSVATRLLGCSRSSCVFIHESTTSYVSWRRMRSSPSSQSMSSFRDPRLGPGRTLAPAPSTAIPEVASDLVCCARRVSDSPLSRRWKRIRRSSIR
jgi:hypothetical protein